MPLICRNTSFPIFYNRFYQLLKRIITKAHSKWHHRDPSKIFACKWGHPTMMNFPEAGASPEKKKHKMHLPWLTPLWAVYAVSHFYLSEKGQNLISAFNQKSSLSDTPREEFSANREDWSTFYNEKYCHLFLL